jgi:hypothetical protein
MAKLIIKAPGMPAVDINLPAGVHRLGRSLNTDCQIAHPSVSKSHCELTIDETSAAIKDLSSTNGTWIDGQRIGQSPLLPGQSVRLGEVEIVYAPADASASGELKLAAPPPPGPEDPPPQPASIRLGVPLAPRRQTNFYKTIPGAFTYPFRRNGLILLVSGTIVFGALNFFLGFHMMGRLFIGWLLGFFFFAFVTGYLFLYMESILTTSALGEGQMPDWPPYEGWWDSAAVPTFRLLGIWACCLGPAFLWTVCFGGDRPGFIPVLLILGLCYFPMAVLAVAMYDSILALNPLLIVASILRVPAEYAVICVLFGVLLTITYLTPRCIQTLNLPFLGVVLSQFFLLYFSAVAMRLAGLLYHSKRAQFGWKF